MTNQKFQAYVDIVEGKVRQISSNPQVSEAYLSRDRRLMEIRFRGITYPTDPDEVLPLSQDEAKKFYMQFKAAQNLQMKSIGIQDPPTIQCLFKNYEQYLKSIYLIIQGIPVEDIEILTRNRLEEILKKPSEVHLKNYEIDFYCDREAKPKIHDVTLARYESHLERCLLCSNSVENLERVIKEEESFLKSRIPLSMEDMEIVEKALENLKSNPIFRQINPLLNNPSKEDDEQ